MLRYEFYRTSLAKYGVISGAARATRPTGRRRTMSARRGTTLIHVYSYNTRGTPRTEGYGTYNRSVSSVVPTEMPMTRGEPFVCRLESISNDFSISLSRMIAIVNQRTRLGRCLSSGICIDERRTGLAIITRGIFVRGLDRAGGAFLGGRRVSDRAPATIGGKSRVNLNKGMVGNAERRGTTCFIFRIGT